MLRAARFLYGYVRHPVPGVVEEERPIEAGGQEVPTTIYRPSAPGRYPGWVVLHGITVPGRAHPTLRRFAHSVAASGGVVMVPEIGSWRDLRIDPEVADRVIGAAAEQLDRMPEVEPGGVGVVGFSFGATQALITASRRELAGAIRRVVAFGGYCDLRAALVFGFTGEYERLGVVRHLEPDPYGRWIVAANYLTDVPEYADMGRVAEGARRLAGLSGEQGIFAGDPVYDLPKAEIRAELDPAERELWDLIAPPSTQAPPPGPARHLAERLASAALARHPALDPRPALPRLRRPTILAHGYRDQLIPYTETLRLRDHLAPACPVYVSISRLYAHSKGAPPLRAHQYPLELARYVRLLSRALSPR